MKFKTKLEKSRYNSAINRINSNIVYAIKKGTRIAAITFAQWDNSDFSNLKDSFYAVSK